jgi:rare lipoprotein A
MLITAFSLPAASDTLGKAQYGVASVYSRDGGNKTASGEELDPEALTGAHRTLPFGTKVKLTNAQNGRSLLIVINDRGPFVKGRVIDVTPDVARVLAISGLAPVTLEIDG